MTRGSFTKLVIDLLWGGTYREVTTDQPDQEQPVLYSLEPAMLRPTRRLTSIEFAIAALISAAALVVVGVCLAMSFMSSPKLARTEIMMFGDATIGWSSIPIDDWCAATSPDLHDWCAQPRTIVINTLVASRSATSIWNSTGYLDTNTQYRDLQINDGKGNDLAIFVNKPNVTLESIALDLCGSYSMAIDSRTVAIDGTCRRHDAELSCGSFTVTTPDELCRADEHLTAEEYRREVLKSIQRTFSYNQAHLTEDALGR